jgi:hypothetical protein
MAVIDLEQFFIQGNASAGSGRILCKSKKHLEYVVGWSKGLMCNLLPFELSFML